MRISWLGLGVMLLAPVASAQAPGKWPPDSLINVQVFPRTMPVMQVIGTMRNFSGALGVRCQFCHVGDEGMPLERMDFASDAKRTKLVARQMMRMVQEINRRIDTLPQRQDSTLQVTCTTCHRGLARPVTLASVIGDAAIAGGADSATRLYRALRERYFGGDAYDFRELSLNSAALRLARANRVEDALALLRLNEELHPTAASVYLFRGNVLLMRADTAGAATAFREAVKRDPRSEARGRLRDIGQQP